MLPILDILTPIVGKVLDFIPDPKQKAEAQMKMQEELIAHQDAILKVMQASDQGQSQVNAEEAKSSNVFISGARPFILWVCGGSFAWQFVLQPIAAFVLNAIHHPVVLPTLDMGQMMPVLMGLLGLSGLRTYEKMSGVNGNHG